MANRTSKNPIVIDTTDTAIAGPLIISAMYWISTAASAKDIAIADTITIKSANTNGDVLIACKAVVAPNVIPLFEGANPWYVNEGLYIEDIDGGELHIFLV